MPILHSPGVMMPGQFGPISRDFLPGHLGFHPHHVDHRNSFGDANDQLDAGIDRFQDSIRRAGRGNENHRDVAAGFLARFPDGVEDRHFVLKLLAAFPGRDAGDDLGAVFHALLRVKSAGAAGDALHAEAGVFIDEERDMTNDWRIKPMPDLPVHSSSFDQLCSRPDREIAPSSKPASPSSPCRTRPRVPSVSRSSASMSSTSKATVVPSRDGCQDPDANRRRSWSPPSVSIRPAPSSAEPGFSSSVSW